MRDAANLAELELEDWRKEAVRLGYYWAHDPAVLVFVRHFG